MSATLLHSSAKPQASLLVACLQLTAAVVVVLPVFAWVGYACKPQDVSASWCLAASGVAGGICWVSAMLALIVACQASRAGYGLHGALGSMGIRLAPPLIAAVATKQWGGKLVEAGFGGQLVSFYLITLLVETILSLRFVTPTTISAPSVAKAG